MNKNYNARPLNELSPFNAQVDIVIPFHGQYKFVTELMQSIFRLTRSNYYQLILVDDNSPNLYFGHTVQQNAIKNAQKTRQPNVLKLIRSNEQKGFAGACKLGYEAGESPYVCFMNSDCRVEDSGWLRNMGETLLNLRSEGVRVVAPTTNNSVGGDPAQTKTDDLQGDVIIGDDSFLTLPCFLCHRQLFQNIGGFLKEYPVGGYEDEEFAYRLRHYGYKQAVCGSSYVHHEGRLTMNEVMRRDPNMAATLNEDNHKRCIEDMKSLRK